LGVVLAHTNPPDWLFNIRVFDVCMLVFASGLTLKYHGNSWKEYLLYLVKRFKRLVVPTWIFLLVYFGFSYFMSLNNDQWDYTLLDYVRSFTFTGGIDYIWIIRVYFLMAVVSPLIVKISGSALFKRYWFVSVLVLFVFNELLGQASGCINNEGVRKLVQGFLVYTLGYSIIEIVACLAKSVRIRGGFFAVFSAAFLILWGFSGAASPQTAKYPPQALYILYGLCVSIGVYCVLEQRRIPDDNILAYAIRWLSSNSLWIYLWHILPVTYLSKMGLGGVNFVVKWLLILVVACILTMAQNAVTYILSKGKR